MLQRDHTSLLINVFVFGQKWSEISFIERDPLEMRHRGRDYCLCFFLYIRGSKKNWTFVREVADWFVKL